MDILGLMDIPLWVFLLLIIVASIFYRYGMTPVFFFKKHGIDAPIALPFFGHSVSIAMKGLYVFDTKYYNLYKDKKVWGCMTGLNPQLVICDLDMIKNILIKDAKFFTNRFVIRFRFSDQVFDKMMSVIKDDHWKHVRQITTPTFSSRKLRKLNVLIQNSGHTLVDSFQKVFKEDKPCDIKSKFGAYSMDVTACTLFGLDVDSQNDPYDPFIYNAKKMFDSFSGMYNWRFMIKLIFPKLMPYLSKIVFSVFTKYTIDFFKDIVNQTLHERLNSNNKQYNDFLQLMVNARVSEKDIDRQTEDLKWSSKGLLDDEITAQCVGALLDSYENMALTLTYAAYALACNPDIQDKLLDEIDRVVGDAKPTYDNIGSCKYLEMVLHEVGRLHSLTPRIDRVCDQQVEVNGVLIQKGWVCVVPVYAIHNDPEIWDAPEKFIPERFSAENKDSIHPASFLQFGLGPRNCVGMRLALLEAKMALVFVLQQFKFVPCKETQIPLVKDHFLRPTKPVMIKLEKRF